MAQTTGTIGGAVLGALVGSIPGWFIAQGKGAAIGAALGGVALGFVGYENTKPAATSTTGTSGLPRGVGGVRQISPPTRRGRAAR